MGVYRGQVVISGVGLTGGGTNTWHFRTLTDALPVDIATQLDGGATGLLAFYTAIGSSLADDATWDFDGEWVRIDEVAAGHTSPSWSFNASTGGAALPSATSLVVGWRSATPGRRRRGRTFLGPMGMTTAQDNGTPQEDDRTSVLAAANDLIDTFDGVSNGAFGIWSTLDEALYDFTAARVANRFAVLRSRRD